MNERGQTIAPMDFLSQCSTTGTRNPILEEIHERSAEVVLAIFRAVKIALIHSMNNDAVKSTLSLSHEVLNAFTESIGRTVTITYAQDTVFVCGELLRASSAVYASASELGSLLAKCGVSEIKFSAEVSRQDLFAFTEMTSACIRDPDRREQLLEMNIPHVHLRAVDAVLAKRENEHELDVKERTVRAYASAILVVRQFYESISAGATMLPHRVKRVAQRLVILAEESEPTLLGMTTLSHAQRDDAVRSVHSAILALVLARQITHDRLVLSRFAMAALLADAGRVHVVGAGGLDRLVTLTDEQESAIPRHAGAVAFITGGINTSSAHRAVVSVESTWLERQELLGSPYGGELDALLQSQLLRLSRALMDFVAPRDIAEALSPFDALAILADESWVDTTMLKLIISSVGFLPLGTVVEFNDGSWGVVTDRSQNDGRTLMPIVKLLTDGAGTALGEETFVDLGLSQTSSDTASRTVVRAISPDRTRFNVTRAFFD